MKAKTARRYLVRWGYTIESAVSPDLFLRFGLRRAGTCQFIGTAQEIVRFAESLAWLEALEETDSPAWANLDELWTQLGGAGLLEQLGATDPPEDPPEDPPAPPTPPAPKGWVCAGCNLRCQNLGELWLHLSKIHGVSILEEEEDDHSSDSPHLFPLRVG